jgi:hypothetical protein
MEKTQTGRGRRSAPVVGMLLAIDVRIHRVFE